MRRVVGNRGIEGHSRYGRISNSACSSRAEPGVNGPAKGNRDDRDSCRRPQPGHREEFSFPGPGHSWLRRFLFSDRDSILGVTTRSALILIAHSLWQDLDRLKLDGIGLFRIQIRWRQEHDDLAFPTNPASLGDPLRSYSVATRVFRMATGPAGAGEPETRSKSYCLRNNWIAGAGWPGIERRGWDGVTAQRIANARWICGEGQIVMCLPVPSDLNPE